MLQICFRFSGLARYDYFRSVCIEIDYAAGISKVGNSECIFEHLARVRHDPKDLVELKQPAADQGFWAIRDMNAKRLVAEEESRTMWNQLFVYFVKWVLMLFSRRHVLHDFVTFRYVTIVGESEGRINRQVFGCDENACMLMVGRCEDGIGTEAAIHRHLKSENRKITDSPGKEWYLSNAEEVSALFRRFREC